MPREVKQREEFAKLLEAATLVRVVKKGKEAKVKARTRDLLYTYKTTTERARGRGRDQLSQRSPEDSVDVVEGEGDGEEKRGDEREGTRKVTAHLGGEQCEHPARDPRRSLHEGRVAQEGDGHEGEQQVEQG